MPIKRGQENVFPIAPYGHSRSLVDLSRLDSIPYCINCTEASTGAVGTFAYDDLLFLSGLGHFAIGKVCSTVEEFYEWAKSEGFLYFDTKNNFVMLRDFPR